MNRKDVVFVVLYSGSRRMPRVRSVEKMWENLQMYHFFDNKCYDKSCIVSYIGNCVICVILSISPGGVSNKWYDNLCPDSMDSQIPMNLGDCT